MKRRVISLMSGGVDSSVATALLKDKGFDVIGVYILGWTGTEQFPCSWQEEEADARRVAEHIGVPFHTVNLSREYEEEVINSFFSDYQAGLTPNPDILCNREIKFKHLWRAVRQFEPDYIATGHYAKLSKIKGRSLIVKPKDADKDQSYFLWGIDKDMLERIVFPLGDLTKQEVRVIAEKKNIPVAKKKDSQGICFVGPLKVREFLRSQVKVDPGQAVLPNGEVVASHEGSELYTIGQRLGAGSVSWTGDAPPLFVVAKDRDSNLLIVSTEEDTYAEELVAYKANWHADPTDSFKCLAKIRYRQSDVDVSVITEKENVVVRFDEPVRAITPGQSIVFYDKKGTLLGGAIIRSVPKADELVQRLNGKRATKKINY